MNVRDLSYHDVRDQLAHSGLRLRIGPVVAHVYSDMPAVARGVALHYSDHTIEPPTGFADFHVSVARPRNVRRWLGPQVLFRLDSDVPFRPLPANQAFPMFEWGLNWCISSHCHQYLTIHAAGVERNGQALILPAPPGSGKSTLCAGLVSRGWRLLSDELTLIDRATALVVPLARPIGLKNDSIRVIRDFSTQAVLGVIVSNTTKGDVTHMKPPGDSVQRATEPARPRWIVLPRYKADSAACLSPLTKAAAFMQLAGNSFNYDLHGETGFKLLAQIIDGSHCYEFTYSRLDEACAIFDELSRSA